MKLASLANPYAPVLCRYAPVPGRISVFFIAETQLLERAFIYSQRAVYAYKLTKLLNCERIVPQDFITYFLKMP